ncbi:gephyrin-like molybdotransferase Glp [Szabonella alba]|uniref:Molybdopterin molybdenumtransferase n=1 Tax=Szabonella alba TaxID=2804194 RepID=A0A8K0V8J8_9RHOB|nr:gephyrin-like molybdotransferase Glp [Szabonella alba]MBL4917467.1 molybdopterin molybdotransferase MoeA [Szabonella alba]
MISVDEALARVFALVSPLPVETVPLRQANGRILAAPVTALRDQPPFDASAMDGYAIHDAARPGLSLRVIGTAQAGKGFAGRVGPGEAVRIFTGAPVPEGADRVVIQEDVTAAGDRITLNPGLDEGRHIRPRGQDFRAGAEVTPRLLRPADLALLASMNIARVPVHRRPVIALIATGDELVMPGETPGPDQIITSNTFALAAMVEEAGGIARMLPIARDTEADLRMVLRLALDADLVVTIGGASVGDHDLVGRVAEAMGMDRAFYKIAMRPGKPLMAGLLQGVPMLGLPGNPVSAIVCAHLFLIPALRHLAGQPAQAPARLRAVLVSETGPAGPRRHYMRARLEPQTDGLPHITPFGLQDSSLLGVLGGADALLIRPEGDGPLPAGSVVEYHPI